MGPCSPSTTPTPVQTPTPTCNASKFLDDSSKLWDKFSDIEKRAQATQRASLSPVIGEMQQVKRDYSYLEFPNCAQDLHDAGLAVMNTYISAYLMFLGNEIQSRTQSEFDNAGRRLSEMIDTQTELYYRMGLPRPTPTLTPSH